MTSQDREPIVLLADDNEDSREIYRMYCEHKGLIVLTAANGDEAVAIARQARPTVIVMDLTMPGMDGWQATRVLKTSPETRDIYIVALTGHASRGPERAAREAGCDHYLVKPCLPEALLEVVLDVIAGRRAPRRMVA
jgi:two-component system cell cycle response regulator DivK